jgi:hypothetical protein
MQIMAQPLKSLGSAGSTDVAWLTRGEAVVPECLQCSHSAATKRGRAS